MSSDSHDEPNLRILVVAPSFDILGGQSVQAARLMERLRNEPSLEIGFQPINPRLPGLLRQLQRISYVRTLVTSIAYVWYLLARVYKYDVLHVFSASYLSFVLAPTPAILIGKLYGKKVLLNYHSGEAEDHLRRWRRTAIPTIKLVDIVVVPSDYLVKVFAEFGLATTPIYNLIETSKFRFRDRVPLRPLFLSNRNLESHYGVDRVLRAFSLVQKDLPDAGLTVTGDGSQRLALEALAHHLNLMNTKFTGRVEPDSMVDFYDAADIYLNSSEIDNQPLSLLEAFACGLPIVTSDAGGIPYIVENERTAMVVPGGDPVGMAEQAKRLLSNPQVAQRMIDEGKKECVRYSWAAVRNEWMRVYEALVRVPTEPLADESDETPSPGQKALTR